VHYLLCVGLIAVGVSIKAIHPYAGKPVNPKYVALLVGGCTFSLPAMAFQQVLHPGFKAFFSAPILRSRRLSLFVAKLLLSFCNLLLPFMLPADTQGWAYLLDAALISMACAVILAFEKSMTCEQALWAFADGKPLEKAHYVPKQFAEPSESNGAETSSASGTTISSGDAAGSEDAVQKMVCLQG